MLRIVASRSQGSKNACPLLCSWKLQPSESGGLEFFAYGFYGKRVAALLLPVRLLSSAADQGSGELNAEAVNLLAPGFN